MQLLGVVSILILGVASAASLSNQDLIQHADYIELGSYVKNQGTACPSGYNCINRGERWALVKRESETNGKCIMVHRGTTDLDENVLNAIAQGGPAIRVEGIWLNAAIWANYALFRKQQNQAINAARSAGTCKDVDMTGHSLGGATALCALVDNGDLGYIDNVIVAGVNRVFQLIFEPKKWWCGPLCGMRETTCPAVRSKAKGIITRYNRGANRGDGRDSVGGFPLLYDHCAHAHIKPRSDGDKARDGENMNLQTINRKWPEASLLGLDNGVLFLLGLDDWHDRDLYVKVIRAAVSAVNPALVSATTGVTEDNPEKSTPSLAVIVSCSALSAVFVGAALIVVLKRRHIKAMEAKFVLKDEENGSQSEEVSNPAYNPTPSL